MIAVVSWQSAVTFIVIATAVAGVFTIGAARAWRSERDAMREQVERLEAEFAKEQAKQTELRHELKSELKAAHYAMEELRKIRDPSEVLQSVLVRLAESKDVTVAAVAELLEKADERAALRDATLIATQREIAEQLERLTDRIVGQVADVVQEKLDQAAEDQGT